MVAGVLLKRKRTIDRNSELFVQPASSYGFCYAKRLSYSAYGALAREFWKSAIIPLNSHTFEILLIDSTKSRPDSLNLPTIISLSKLKITFVTLDFVTT